MGNKGLARELGYPECNGYLQRQIGPTQFGSNIENDDTTHTNTDWGYEKVYYLRNWGLWERPGQLSQAGPKWLERVREGDWPGFLLWLGPGWVFPRAHRKGLLRSGSLANAQGESIQASLSACPGVEHKGKKGWVLKALSSQISKSEGRLHRVTIHLEQDEENLSSSL